MFLDLARCNTIQYTESLLVTKQNSNMVVITSIWYALFVPDYTLLSWLRNAYHWIAGIERQILIVLTLIFQ